MKILIIYSLSYHVIPNLFLYAELKTTFQRTAIVHTMTSKNPLNTIDFTLWEESHTCLKQHEGD